jgi:hypothetical protein
MAVGATEKKYLVVIGPLLKDEVARMGKEAAVALFKPLFLIRLEELRKTTINVHFYINIFSVQGVILERDMSCIRIFLNRIPDLLRPIFGEHLCLFLPNSQQAIHEVCQLRKATGKSSMLQLHSRSTICELE